MTIAYQENKAVLLINPPYTPYYASDHFSMSRPNKSISTLSIPYGLACLAGYLRENKIRVKCLDLEVTPKSFVDIVQMIKEESYDIVGFTATSPLINIALQIAKYIKENTNAFVILGGVHASAEPLETMSVGVFDALVIGEGELPLRDLCLNVPIEKIPGIVYKNRINTRYELINDLDSLPFPARDLFPQDLYRASIHRDLDPQHQQPYYTMMTARGCPYRCKFCYSKGIFLNKTRSRTARSVIEEIKSISKSHGEHNQGPLKLIIYDDTFTYKKSRAIEICEGISGLNIVWGCNTRVDCLDSDVLQSMKQSGCKRIYIGIENGDDAFLKKIDKSLTRAKICQGVDLIKKNQIEISASYIIGIPGETRHSINTTIDFAMDLNTDFAHFYTFTPDPGSPFYIELKSSGIIQPLDWLDYNALAQKASLALGEEITYQELITLTKKAYHLYYTNLQWDTMRRSKIKTSAELEQHESLVKHYCNHTLFEHKH